MKKTSYNQNLLLEGEKEQILSLYGIVDESSNQHVIVDWVSPDDKYVIFLDELIDVENKKLIGNIWENFDNFKFFLKHSFEASKTIPTLVKESVLNELNKLVITESTCDYSMLKPYVKQFMIEEGIWSKLKGGLQDFGEWGKKNIDSAITGVQGFAKTVGSGAVDFVKNISRGDFAKAFDIIGKGILYLMRSIRSAMYHPVGMVVDAIFLTLAPATAGITQVLKWLPWAVIVALDILEITNIVQPEEEMPMYMRFLLLGANVLGLVLTAGVAAPIRTFVKGLRGTQAQVAANISKNPSIANRIREMLPAFKKLPKFFETASKYLKNSKLGSLFSQAFSRLGEIIKNATSEISKLLGTPVGKATAAASVTTGVAYGAEKGVEKYFDYKQTKDDEELIQSIQQSDLSNFEF
jgi:hypothetical protein